MPEPPQCEAELYEPHTETYIRCANVAAAKITEDGEVNFYCRAHTKLTREFLAQARQNAIRWSSVIQMAPSADA
jgi:hypothetical protein